MVFFTKPTPDSGTGAVAGAVAGGSPPAEAGVSKNDASKDSPRDGLDVQGIIEWCKKQQEEGLVGNTSILSLTMNARIQNIMIEQPRE